MIKIYKQLLSIMSSLLLVFTPALSAAGVETDGTTNTTLESAPNGVEVVNIADPNAQGLSHNRYNHYNVSKEGLILNNSMDTTVKTQLGGFVYGNSHLTSNAKVILNEVTSTNPSQLGGYTEVAGKRADLVIANPNGITLNGAGFINTSNITLSTGKPTIQNGAIFSYGTQIGEIAIEGEGLDATQTDSAHLYAKVLKLNANIYANELDAKFGSLDASALGSMYANAIILEGTDQGVGVNLPPEVIASNGDITVTADGSIKLQKMTAHNLAVQSTQNIELENEIYTSNSARLEASDEVIVKDGMIVSQNSLDIKAQSVLNQNMLQSTNELSIETTQYIQNDAKILSEGLLQLISNGELINNALISGNDIDVQADIFTNNQTLFAANDMNIYISNILQNNQNANIFALNNLTIAANKLLNKGIIQSSNNLTIESAQYIKNNNEILSSGLLQLVSDGNLINNGQISANDLEIATDTLINNQILFAANDTNLYISSRLQNNYDANIVSVNNMTIVANEANEKTDIIENISGNIQTYNGVLNIQTNELLNENIIKSGSDLTIESTQYIQNNAEILSSGLLQLITDGEIMNNALISANDVDIYANTLINNQTLFAGNDMKLYVSSRLQNNQNANIFALNNLTIAANEANEKTDLIENISANIETYNGNINIFAKQLINKRVKDVDDNVFFTSNTISDSVYFNESIGYSRASVVGENGLLVLKGEGRNDTFRAYVNDFGYRLSVDLAREPFSTHFASLGAVLKEKLPYDDPNYGRSTILAGNDLHIVSDSVVNEISDIVSTNEMYIDAGSFENREKAYEGTLSLTLYNSVDCDAEPERCLLYDGYSMSGIQKKRHDGWLYQDGKLLKYAAYYGDYTYGPYAVKRDDVSLPANVSAGGTIYGDINQLNNGTIQEDTTILKSVPLDITPTASTSDIKLTAPAQDIPTIELPEYSSGFFVLSKDPQSSYIIETNPEFAIYENFISSDYMLSHIEYDAEATTKRLGDALYENRLVRDSILEQTGQRFLNSTLASDNEQYRYLMDNAIEASQDLQLTPGIALTKEQINALTKDIVWMEEKEVQGEKVLVPVVYIANVQNYKLRGARIIAANDIDINTVELGNTGIIKAGDNMSITATDAITNKGGAIQASQDLVLQATNEITNTSASIKADNIELISTEGSIINDRAQKEVSWRKGGEYSNYTLTGEASTIEAANTLDINAKKTMSVTGSSIGAKELNIAANDVEIKTTEDKSDFFIGDSDNYNKANFTKHLSSNINADNININAVDTTSIKGSNVHADEDINIQSKKLDVLAVNNSSYSEIKRTKKGTFSTKSSLDIGLKEQVQGSSIEADNLHVNTTKDINLESVNINVDNSIDLASQEGNVNMSAKTYTNAEYHESSKSSFGGLVGSRSIDSWSKTKLGDSVTTAKNNIVVDGKNINLVANDINAKAGSVQFNAQEDINIASGLEQSDEQHIKESTGLSFGISGGKFTYAQTTKDSKTDTTITNKASNIDADNIVLTSKGSTNILASNLDAKTMQVTSEKDFNILSDQDVKMHNEEHSKKDIGIELTLNTKEASLFAGYWEDAKGETTTNKDVAKSTLNVGSLDVSAKNVNIAGSDVFTNDMSIDSENTKVLSSTATTDTQSYTKSVKSGISVGVKQNISDAVDSIKNIADAKEATGGISRTLKAYDAVNSFSQKPVDAGVYAVYEQSSTNTQTSMEQAVASNLYAANNMILHSDENIEVGGSSIYAANNLNIEAKNIDIHSTTQNYSQETSSDSRNAKVNLFGTKMGEVTLGFQDASQSMQVSTESNSYIVSGGKATITSTEDIALKGALVSANDLEVNAGRNLVMESVQDTQSIQGESKGGTVSGNVATMTPTGAYANYGTTSGDKKWVNEVTSLNGENSIKVNVAETTTIKGASITNMDASGIDQGNLQLNTKELKSEDIHDHDKYASTNVGVGFGSVDSKPSLNSIDFANSTKEKEQIVRATVGNGEIITNSDTTTLNRDVTRIKEITKDESSSIELYASSSSLQALSDPLQAYDDLKQKAEDLGLASYKEIVENLPSASKGKDGEGDIIDNTIGALVDAGGEWSFGVIPTVKNDGGYVTQIVTQFFGDNRDILKTTEESKFIALGLDKSKGDYVQATIDGQIVYITNPNKTVRIDENINPNDPLKEYKIHLSSQDIKDAGIDTIFTNGLNNIVSEGATNQQQQQGNPTIGMLNYNTSHGTLADLIETGLEKTIITLDTIPGVQELGYMINGSARQTGDSINQLAQINEGNINIAAHSQGTGQTYLGLQQHKEEIAQLLKENPNAVLTLQNSGSPVSSKAVEDLVVNGLYGGKNEIKVHTGTNDVVSVFRSQVNPGDFIGLLGGNFGGINNNAPITTGDFWDRAGYTITRGVPTLMNGSLQNNQDDPSKTSPHSGYPCVIGCGDGGYTPNDVKFYFDVTTQKDTPLLKYYNDIEVEPSKAKFNTQGSN